MFIPFSVLTIMHWANIDKNMANLDITCEVPCGAAPHLEVYLFFDKGERRMLAFYLMYYLSIEAICNDN